jgi:hypothetical protein
VALIAYAEKCSATSILKFVDEHRRELDGFDIVLELELVDEDSMPIVKFHGQGNSL